MDRKRFFDDIRRAFFKRGIGNNQLARIEAVINGLVGRGVPLRHAAYILATAHHESDRFKTMEEYASGAAYEGRKDLGNTMPGDGKRYKGRGLVQITGRRNYADWSKRLHVDLIGTPERAAALSIAVPVLIDGMLLGTFTGKKLADYDRYGDMRRVVNGTDRAAQIAWHAERFEAALRDAGYLKTAGRPEPAAPAPEAPTPHEPAPEKPRKPLRWSKRFWTWLTTGGAGGLYGMREMGLFELDWTFWLILSGLIVALALIGILTMPEIRAKIAREIG